MLRCASPLIAAAVVTLCLTAHAADPPAPGSDVVLDLGDRLTDVELRRTAEGDLRFVVPAVGDGGEVQLTPEQYAAALDAGQRDQRAHSWLFVLFNISSWFGVLWVTLGLAGQVIFTGRMIVQWLTSERARRSIVPPSFWWMSLIGATMLITYFFWRKDVVGVLGQGAGWLIYVRNLWMIYRPTRPGGGEFEPTPPWPVDASPEPLPSSSSPPSAASGQPSV